jgi:drug/metabolite transporter (DMT)-like permease
LLPSSFLAPPYRLKRWLKPLLAWYFVIIWGSGFIATKIAMQHTSPFTFLSIRFGFGTACLIPIIWLIRPQWPKTAKAFFHVIVAGLLMHAVHLGGSHYSQYLGLSAGITAVLLCAQPVLTALFAARWLNEKLSPYQLIGIVLGLAGVTLIVWHKLSLSGTSIGGFIAVGVALLGVTVGTLYQRYFCADVDLRAAALLQFSATFCTVTPLAFIFETHQVRWSWALCGALLFLVIGASLLAVSAWHYLMREGEATRVSSLIYLTPAFAIVPEYFWFGIEPTLFSAIGIIMTCLGVALVAYRTRVPPAPQKSSPSHASPSPSER